MIQKIFNGHFVGCPVKRVFDFDETAACFAVYQNGVSHRKRLVQNNSETLTF